MRCSTYLLEGVWQSQNTRSDKGDEDVGKDLDPTVCALIVHLSAVLLPSDIPNISRWPGHVDNKGRCGLRINKRNRVIHCT